MSETKITNFMRGTGTVKGSLSMNLDTELKIALPLSDLSCELELALTRKNFISGRVEVLKLTNPVMKITTDNDTYVTTKNKYYNYALSTTLKQGTYEGYDYQALISFDDLYDIPANIAKGIVNSRLVLNAVSPYTGTIRIYEASYEFKENNVSWFTHPGKGELIGELTCNNAEVLKINLKRYAKSIATKQSIHNGFVIETDNYLNIYSSNSNDKGRVPYMEVEYYDSNLLCSTHVMDCELDLREVKPLNCELQLELPFPEVECELLLSKTNMDAELQFMNSTYLVGEVPYNFSDETALDSYVPYSQDFIHSEIKLGVTKDLDTELQLVTINSDYIPAEVSLTPVKVLLGELKIGYKEPLDVEMELICREQFKLDCEIPFTKPELDCEMNIIPRGQDILDSEVVFKSTGNKDILNGEILISKPELKCELIMKPAIELDSELQLVFTKALDCEMIFDFGEQEFKLPAELVYKSTNNKNELDTEIKLGYTIDLPSELNILYQTRLESEMIVMFDNVLIIPAELELIKKGTEALESELDLKFVNKLDSELQLVFKDVKLPLDSEILFKDTNVLSSIDCFILLALPGDSKLDAELNLKFKKEEFLPSELNLMFISKLGLDLEMVVEIEGQIPLDSELILDPNVMETYFYMIKNR